MASTEPEPPSQLSSATISPSPAPPAPSPSPANTTVPAPGPSSTARRTPPPSNPVPTPQPAAPTRPRTNAMTTTTEPAPPPDILSFFDPASVGGGGPLKRISTQHSIRTIRSEVEARERAAREAAGLPAPTEDTLLGRFRSASLSRRKGSISKQGGIGERTRLPPIERSESHRTIAETPGEEGHGSKEKDYSHDVPRTPSGEHLALEGQEIGQGHVQHEYPDGGYGWVVLICCITLAGLTMGWGMSWGVFQQYYAENVFPGANTAYLSTAGTCAPLMMNLVCFVSGRMGDRYGFKRILYISAVVAWVGLFSAAFSTEIWHVLLTQGIITGIGQGMALPLFMSLPSQWFYRYRGFASGAAIGGSGLGGGITTIMVRSMLGALGLKKTLIICSFLNLSLSVLATALIRTRPTSPEAQGGGRGPWVDLATLKTPKFWSVIISLLVAVLGYATPFVWLPQYIATSLPDTSGILTAIPVTLMGFAVCIGRALAGFAADQLGPINTYILIFALSGVIQLSLWLTATGFAQVCVFAVLFGIVAPGYIGLLPQIIVQLFGPANLATNVGLLLLANAPGNFISGPVGGVLFDATGRTSFRGLIILGASAQFVGAAVALYARFAIERRVWSKV